MTSVAHCDAWQCGGAGRVYIFQSVAASSDGSQGITLWYVSAYLPRRHTLTGAMMGAARHLVAQALALYVDLGEGMWDATSLRGCVGWPWCRP
jgi:hypothetical protein